MDIKATLIMKTYKNYLFSKNQDKVKELLEKDFSSFTENEIVDYYMALHLTLEIGTHKFFNGFFEQNSFLKKKYEDCFYSYADNVGYIDKIAFFIMFNSFLINNEEKDEAKKYYKILKPNAIGNFNTIRNKLMHGQTFYQVEYPERDKKNHVSENLKLISLKEFKEQILLFIKILDAFSFFTERFETKDLDNEYFKNKSHDLFHYYFINKEGRKKLKEKASV